MNEQIIVRQNDDRVDELEAAMLENFPEIDCPVKHIFTPGLYTREIFMPEGSLITSKIHRTTHPFFVTKGKVSVWIDDGEEIFIEAPYSGITKPGTRRVLYVWEDTTWATVHANPNDETLEEIEERIIEKHDNPLLDEAYKERMNLIKKELLTQ